MRRWLVLVLAAPLAVGSVLVDQAATVDSTSQGGFATLSQADAGTATIGTDGTQATVDVAATSILIVDDILDVTSTDDAWQMRAELVSHSGFGVLETITLSLSDGVLTETQIIIVDGVPTQSLGLDVDLPTSGDTELLALVTAGDAGTVELELVLTRDSGPGPEIRYPVTVNVT